MDERQGSIDGIRRHYYSGSDPRVFKCFFHESVEICRDDDPDVASLYQMGYGPMGIPGKFPPFFLFLFIGFKIASEQTASFGLRLRNIVEKFVVTRFLSVGLFVPKGKIRLAILPFEPSQFPYQVQDYVPTSRN